MEKSHLNTKRAFRNRNPNKATVILRSSKYVLL